MHMAMNQPGKLRTVIVDDHPVVRIGIRHLLESEGIEVCGEAGDENGALRLVEEFRPDIVLLDISLKGSDGLAVASVLRRRYPCIAVLMLSMHSETSYAQKALRSGARGYVMKERCSSVLVEAIRTVARGDIFVSEEVRKQIMQSGGGDSRPDSGAQIVGKLSNRERQVFSLIGSGNSAREIAGRLQISVKTVETHVDRIKAKLGLPDSRRLMLAAAAFSESDGAPPAGVPR